MFVNDPPVNISTTYSAFISIGSPIPAIAHEGIHTHHALVQL